MAKISVRTIHYLFICTHRARTCRCWIHVFLLCLQQLCPHITLPEIITEKLWLKCPRTGSGVCTDLTHLELEETPFLFHLLCDLCPSDLRADHPVLLGMLSFLLLYLCTDAEERTVKRSAAQFSPGGCFTKHDHAR